MNVDILYNGGNTVNAAQIFENNIIRNLKTQTYASLNKKRGEIIERCKNARINGIAKSQQFSHVDDAIRRGFVTTRSKPPVLTTPDQLMKLCDMFEKGLIDKSQFELSKEHYYQSLFSKK